MSRIMACASCAVGRVRVARHQIAWRQVGDRDAVAEDDALAAIDDGDAVGADGAFRGAELERLRRGQLPLPRSIAASVNLPA